MKDALAAVLFDIGDTLIETGPRIRSAQMIACATLSPLVGCDPEYMRDTWEEVASQGSADHTDRFLGEPVIALETINRLGVSGHLAMQRANALLTYYREAIRASITPADSFVTLLSRLHSVGLSLGAVSNGRSLNQTEILLRLGLLSQFDSVVISEEVGEEKPSAVPFLTALTELNIDAGRALYVGDEYRRDYLGARSAGLGAVVATWFVRDPQLQGSGAPTVGAPEDLEREIAKWVNRETL